MYSAARSAANGANVVRPNSPASTASWCPSSSRCRRSAIDRDRWSARRSSLMADQGFQGFFRPTGSPRSYPSCGLDDFGAASARASSGNALSVGMRLTASTRAARAGWPRRSKSSRAARSSNRVAPWRRASSRAAPRSACARVGVGCGCGRAAAAVRRRRSTSRCRWASCSAVSRRARACSGWPAAINSRPRTASKKVMIDVQPDRARGVDEAW